MATGRISRWVAAFLRVLLMPVILIGIPAWPLVGLLCAVPVIGIFAIPTFVLLTLLLLYSVAWFSYLVLAQADPPASSQHGALSHYLPFLPYSPMRCLKINWAAFTYATSALKVALPAVLDWSYRRVMVLGTQGGGGIVRENVSYGSQRREKRLDVYLPPSSASATAPNAAAGSSAGMSGRLRKHSTHFAEPPPATALHNGDEDLDATPRPDGTHARPVKRSPVIVVIPSPIPPLTWTQRRKTYLQLALRLRRMGYCVVVPDLTWYPEGRVNASIVDLRLVLRWVAENCKRYGGDEKQIYLLGHGMSAHLAMLTLTQEAVVLSREGYLHRQSDARSKRGSLVNWDNEEADETVMANANGNGHHYGANGYTAKSSPYANGAHSPNLNGHSADAGEVQSRSPTHDNAWVDEPGEEDLPPGAVMNGEETLESIGHRRVGGLGDLSTHGNIAFPSSSAAARQRSSHNEYASSSPPRSAEALNAQSGISNGLRRVEIYQPEIAIPPIAGVILLAGVFDVIKSFRNESDRGVEHLSVLRRSCGPSHTACLLHSPAHLLYAAKNILDTSLLPPRFLLVHGGKDAVVDISQSTLLKTLLSGIGVTNVKLRAYRELGHVEAIASLFLGMGKASTRYSKQILHDIGDFVATA